MDGIEEKMAEQGYSREQIKKAQALCSFALYPYGKEENFGEKLVGCFDSEQWMKNCLQPSTPRSA